MQILLQFSVGPLAGFLFYQSSFPGAFFFGKVN